MTKRRKLQSKKNCWLIVAIKDTNLNISLKNKITILKIYHKIFYKQAKKKLNKFNLKTTRKIR